MKRNYFSVSLSPEHIEHLKAIAIEESYKRKSLTSYIDLVRELIDKAYPLPVKENNDNR